MCAQLPSLRTAYYVTQLISDRSENLSLSPISLDYLSLATFPIYGADGRHIGIGVSIDMTLPSLARVNLAKAHYELAFKSMKVALDYGALTGFTDDWWSNFAKALVSDRKFRLAMSDFCYSRNGSPSRTTSSASARPFGSSVEWCVPRRALWQIGWRRMLRRS